jgi:putative transposase
VRLLADHCDLYNAALMERREAWRTRRVSISYGTQSAQLKEIRRADPDGHGRHSFTAQQQTLRRLDTVFGAFFDRAGAAEKAGQRSKPGYPRFKPYQRFSQVLFVAGDGARWQPSGSGKWAYASFKAVGTVKVRQHRPVPGTVKALQSRRSSWITPRTSTWVTREALADFTFDGLDIKAGTTIHLCCESAARQREHWARPASHRLQPRPGIRRPGRKPGFLGPETRFH